MLERSDPRARRYSAFLSYSRTDVAFARRLQRRLEAYRLPGSVNAATGSVEGRRLRPVFRDDDELVAGHDLTQAVREALANSDHLVVVCSPRAAQSAWVAREIELFRRLHGGERVLSALIEGEPDEAFPAALRRRPHGRAADPLAADFRKGAGSERMALLKLVAPLAGVGLDELIHRDGQRRMRQTAGVAGVSVAGMAAMGVLAGVAYLSQQAAERERNKAQALVGAMSNDLRSGAQDVAGLGYLGKMNKAAADYFRGQDPRQLTDQALTQRAKLLQNMGEDDEKRDNLAAAQRDFAEAHRDTAALLAKSPRDPQRIFDHAQSEYWVGYISWRLEDAAGARIHYQAYADLADQLVRIDPSKDAWLLETAYAATNLGSLALRREGRPQEAEAQFRKALEIRRRIAARKPDDPKLQHDTANALAWVADAQRISGDLKGALATRKEQRSILAALVSRSPNNLKERDALLGNELAVARIEIAQNGLPAAVRRLQSAQAAELVLVRADPDNKDFQRHARMFDLFTVKAWLAQPARLRPPVSRMAAKLDDCQTPAGLKNQEIDDFCAILLARVREAAGDHDGAKAALAAVQGRASRRGDVLTAHWGLNLQEEAGAIQLAAAGGR